MFLTLNKTTNTTSFPLDRFANTCVEDKEGLGEWHEPENKENGEEQAEE